MSYPWAAMQTERIRVGQLGIVLPNGLLPHGRLLRSIELFATEVAPRVGSMEAPTPAVAAPEAGAVAGR